MLMELCLEHIGPEPMGDSSQRSVGPPHLHRVQSTRLHRYQFSFVIVKEEGRGDVRRVAGRKSCPYWQGRACLGAVSEVWRG